jgi:hypothetical protein
VKIEKEPDNPNKLRLIINGMNIIDWFKAKFRELKQSKGIYKSLEFNKSKCLKL